MFDRALRVNHGSATLKRADASLRIEIYQKIKRLVASLAGARRPCAWLCVTIV
jgi:hypothetical protein